MRKDFLQMLLAGSLATVGCSFQKKGMDPLAPKKPVAPATVLMTFTKKVKGPLELIIDGTRIPVQQGKKPGSRLVITGLPAGKHKYFLSSPVEAFGFDQGEFEVSSDKGTFLPLFAQHFNAILYGKSEPTPPAEGLPGVTARLEP